MAIVRQTKAQPYPSTITISNLLGCTVRKVTVTIHGFSHSFPSDVTILLVGPQGHQAILMSQVGGQERLSVTNLTLTLDEDAVNTLPVYAGLQSGAFRPTNGYLTFGRPGLPYNLPFPAPLNSSNAPATLTVFNGTDPNGTWNLFVVDDSGGDSGTIASGWTLNLIVSDPLCIFLVPPRVVISWPAQMQDVVLQTSPDLGSPGTWVDWPGMPIESVGRLYVTDSIAPGSMFYRLKYLTESKLR